MVERNGFWDTDMDSSPGSASDEFCDLEQVMGSAEFLFSYWRVRFIFASAITCLRAA